MRFGLDMIPFGVHSEPAVLVEHAVAAEAAGWEGLFLWDHLNSSPWMTSVADPWAAIAAAAARTSRLVLGTAITPLPRHHPAMLARTLTTIDRLSGGRVVLGAGLGVDDESALYGWPADTRRRGEMVDRSLSVMARLMAGETVTDADSDGGAGSHWSLDSVTLGPLPVQQPRVPFWIGSAVLARVARWDGWIIGVSDRDGSLTMTPSQLRAQIERIRELRVARGDGSPFEVAIAGVTRPAFDSPLAGPASHPNRELPQAFEEAGATWWLEMVGGGRTTEWLAATRALIEAGPPVR